MAFKEVASLDADVTVAIGKTDKKGKPTGPKSVEGYYLGNRSVASKRGPSVIHFLQTEEGNLGVWGTTDMNRKLSGVAAGTMVRISANGTRPTPNGDMYLYKVEQDPDNTIEVADFSGGNSGGSVTEYADDGDDGEDDDSIDESDDGDSEAQAALLAAERKAKFQAALAKGRTSKVK